MGINLQLLYISMLTMQSGILVESYITYCETYGHKTQISYCSRFLIYINYMYHYFHLGLI